METIPMTTMSALIERYDVLLFDAYGVLVHAHGALPGAAALLDRLHTLGKPYYLLTNDASKLPSTAVQRYRGFGLQLSEERIITSGGLLANYFMTHHLQGSRCVVLGPQDSQRYVELAGGQVVSPEAAFDGVVIGDESGFPFLETVDTVLSALFHKIDRGESVFLISPNPDVIYPKTDQQFGIASGSVALLFEAALRLRYPHRPELRFTSLGKPHAAIYAEAVRRSGSRHAVMIGDQLETDIRGARAYGLDAALIHTGVTTTDVQALPEEVRPTCRLLSLLD